MLYSKSMLSRLVHLLTIQLCVRNVRGANLRSVQENIHVAYQVGCSAYSLHGAIALDWSWQRVAHPGRLTRIVCGCDNQDDKERLSKSPLQGSPKFAVFFTRDWNLEVPKIFPQAHGDTYHAYNHPFGLASWIHAKGDSLSEEFVAYVEPDMIFTQPFLYHLPDATPRAKLGQPVAQYYNNLAYCPNPCTGGDPGWAEFITPEVCGPNCDRRHNITETENQRSYAVGPPAIMHKSDWKSLADRWCNFSVNIRAHGHMKSNGQGWLRKGEKVYIAEMLGYSLAAWSLGLEHQIVHHITSDAFDKCQHIDTTALEISPLAGCQSPHMIHYCFAQNVETPMGHWMWNKYRMPVSWGMKGAGQWQAPLFMDCDMPLLEEPPTDFAKIMQSSPAMMKLSPDDLRHRQHIMWLIQKITAAYNGGIRIVKEASCEHPSFNGSNRYEQRQLLRVDEGTWFVPAQNLKGGLPLASRIAYKVRE